jgi:hypothetical protein
MGDQVREAEEELQRAERAVRDAERDLAAAEAEPVIGRPVSTRRRRRRKTLTGTNVDKLIRRKAGR